MPHRPKLGQHFLSDAGLRRRIAEVLNLRSDDLVVEIGAGHGAMTELLAEQARRVIAIELDSALVEKLKERLRTDPRIEIFESDILSTDLAVLCRRYETEQCFVFGNLPYYITSPIIHHLFSFWTSIRSMALLLQREVALRLTAAPGTRAYGYLSVLTQFYSQPRIVLGVPRGAFSPAPKVHSALVELQMTPRFPDWFQVGGGCRLGDRASLPQDPPRLEVQTRFLDFVKGCFAQKRKNLPNNLARTHPRARVEQELADLGLSSTIRAEQLSLDQFASLFRRLSTAFHKYDGTG